MTSPQRPRAAATPTASPEGVTADLLPCPLCGETLEIRTGANPYGRHSKDSDCFFAAHAVNIPHDVERWNRRTPDLVARQEIARLTGERDEVRRLYDKNRAFLDGKIAEFETAESALAAQAQRRDEVVAILREIEVGYRTHAIGTLASRALNLLTPEPK